MPYLFRVDGKAQKNRGNVNLGVDGRYFINNHIHFGGRFAVDLETRGGSYRQLSLAPGVGYRWLMQKRFSPFVRFDVPVILRGALNNAGSSKKTDFGVSIGGGVVWDLGGALGIPNTAIRYDFNFQYLLGVGAAVRVLALELFKFGLEYRF